MTRPSPQGCPANARSVICLRHATVCALAGMGLAVSVPAAAKVEGDTLILGAAVSLTGKYSTNGKNTQDGYNLAVKRVNEMGGVKVGGKAYQLKVLYYDDESTSARGAQLAERLIRQDGVKFVLGPYSSGLTKAMAPVTEKYKIPMVEGNGADRNLFTQGYRYMFAVLNTSDYYLRAAINLAAEQAQRAGKSPKGLKVAIAVENDNFSQDVRDGVAEDAKRLGMQVLIDEKLPPELNDMSVTLAKVKALKPDILVVSGHEKGAALAVRQVSEMRIDVPMLALTHCDSAQIIEKFGKRAEYAVCGSQWDRALGYKDRWFGTADQYAQRFEKEYHYEAPYQAAESSAAVLTFVDAFEHAGSFDTEKVRDALAGTDLMTFYGPLKFDQSGKNVAKSMVLYQVQDGKFKVVAPAKWASSKVIYPAPPWEKRE
ncbi:amino acid ABC transporter substrate-binding protein [Cupriavidus sp. WKF15]|uniref:amino acid ABC transporter substrate-binding protein n=1 Tax=Cupriavidus sp. WKF15 TaxID=3032282 RepID=UPI0023E17D12|nr:amino acid ABC transporter substrate-binding protein [Cupriavidus sp. WKF15]WER46293.1 amino acid ABC transporter substrate-binding protein [Cupriavidus sp. WKF15]